VKHIVRGALQAFQGEGGGTLTLSADLEPRTKAMRDIPARARIPLLSEP